MSEESERAERPEGSGDAGDGSKAAAEETKGVREGVEASKGDPRLVLLLNAVLSTWLAWTAVWGLDLLAVVDYSLTNVGTLAIVIFAVTYLVVLR